jgi:hypothetical protein
MAMPLMFPADQLCGCFLPMSNGESLNDVMPFGVVFVSGVVAADKVA